MGQQSVTIETARLRLRSFRESDLEDLARLNADPDVMRYVGQGRPLSRAESWRQISTIVGHQQLRGYSIWAVEDRATGQFVGRVGPWFPEGWPILEVGWLIDPLWQRQGLATEAARAALDWVFAHLSVEQIGSLIAPDNLASARVAEKLGATRAQQINDPALGQPADLWLHRRSATSGKGR